MKTLNVKTMLLSIVASVLLVSTAVAGDYKKSYKMKKDIVDVAASNPEFSTLVAAVKAAGLVEALKSEGPLTVFAPTNEAFEKLPAGTLENLLKPENKEMLISILTYHVVPGKVTSKEVAEVNSATSLLGQDIKVKVNGSTVMVDNATVVSVDVDASNGVIHVIDSVIIPSE